jgi:hypothetical protein
MKSVTKLFGFYRKGFIAVYKSRKVISYFARNVQIEGNVYIVIILLEHSSQVMSLVFGVQVKEIQVSEEEQNGDNKQSKYSSLHSE